MRQVVLDTETTGLEPADGHRIIEIGCVELLDRRLSGRHYHQYLNPERKVDAGALEVHGLDDAFLQDKPRFADVCEDFLAFITGAELIIHNAPFDVGFIDTELRRLDPQARPLNSCCHILDTLALAREMHPGQKNNLDALCRRYQVDNSERDLHGALLDAEILADVYLAMTGGQTTLVLEPQPVQGQDLQREQARSREQRASLRLLQPTDKEEAAHAARLQAIDKASEGRCLWLLQESESGTAHRDPGQE